MRGKKAATPSSPPVPDRIAYSITETAAERRAAHLRRAKKFACPVVPVMDGDFPVSPTGSGSAVSRHGVPAARGDDVGAANVRAPRFPGSSAHTSASSDCSGAKYEPSKTSKLTYEVGEATRRHRERKFGTSKAGPSSRPNIASLFSAQDAPPAEAALQGAVAERRAAHLRRAKRFGVPVVPVVPVVPGDDTDGHPAGRTTLSGQPEPPESDITTGPGEAAQSSSSSELRAQRPNAFGLLDGLNVRPAAVRHGFATGFDITAAAEVARRAARQVRFGQPDEEEAISPRDIAVIDPLECRRVPSPREVLRRDVLHMFGVDEMGTEDIVCYFHGYGLKWIEWINDSSCNVAFEDEYSVKRVLEFMTNEDDESVAVHDSQCHGDMESEAASAVVPLPEELEWRKARPAKVGKANFVFWMRMATETDVRPRMPNPRSKWSRTVLGKTKWRRVMDDRAAAGRGRMARGRHRAERGRTGVSGSRIGKLVRAGRIYIDRPLSEF